MGGRRRGLRLLCRRGSSEWPRALKGPGHEGLKPRDIAVFMYGMKPVPFNLPKW